MEVEYPVVNRNEEVEEMEVERPTTIGSILQETNRKSIFQNLHLLKSYIYAAFSG